MQLGMREFVWDLAENHEKSGEPQIVGGRSQAHTTVAIGYDSTRMVMYCTVLALAAVLVQAANHG